MTISMDAVFVTNVSDGDGDYQPDPDGALPDDDYFNFICWGVILPIVGVFGIIGNTLTVMVLWRREMHTTFIYLLRFLVITDTGIILMGLILLTPLSISAYTGSMLFVDKVMYPILYTPCNFLLMVVQQCNVQTVVAIAVQRYVSICHPFKAHRICTKRSVGVSLVVISVVSVAYNIPRLFATSVRHCSYEVKSTGYGCYVLNETEFGMNHYYKSVYVTWMYILFIFLIPLAVLVILSVFIIRELIYLRIRRIRIGANSPDDKEGNFSLALILIVVVFILCQSAGLVAQLEVFSRNLFLIWISVSNTLYVVNSSVNFIIYAAAGKNFRTALLNIFRKRHADGYSCAPSFGSGPTTMQKTTVI